MKKLVLREELDDDRVKGAAESAANLLLWIKAIIDTY